MVLFLDDVQVPLKAGDVVVQRGTNHAWVNMSDKVARMVFILVDGRFEDDLKTLLGDEMKVLRTWSGANESAKP
jgi:hypothetical protein